MRRISFSCRMIWPRVLLAPVHCSMIRSTVSFSDYRHMLETMWVSLDHRHMYKVWILNTLVATPCKKKKSMTSISFPPSLPLFLHPSMFRSKAKVCFKPKKNFPRDKHTHTKKQRSRFKPKKNFPRDKEKKKEKKKKEKATVTLQAQEISK